MLQFKDFNISKIFESRILKDIVYHGSRYNFDSFTLDSGGKSNSLAKIGIWMTDTEEFAENFVSDSFYGERNNYYIYECRVNIKNPLIYTTTEIDKTLIDKLIKEVDLYRYEQKEIINKYKNKGYTYYHQFLYSNDESYKSDRDRYNSIKSKIKNIEDDIVINRYTDSYQKFKIDMYKFANQSPHDAIVGGLGMAYEGDVDKYRTHLLNKGYDSIFILNTKYDVKYTSNESNNQYVILDVDSIEIINKKIKIG